MVAPKKTPPDANRPAGLGTFTGVFTPSILTILGIILFLRLGYVVGDAGLARALVIILVANVISVVTSLSLSAIATNLRVKGGGDYYLISRTLGVEFGGALGLVLFLAQAVSIAFYAIGFGEAVAAIVNRFGGIFGLDPARVPQIVAAAAVVLLFVLAWLGSDWASRFQFVVMAVLFAALAGFFYGGIVAWDTEQLRANVAPSGSLPFWALFALFFPAVTGFTQGVSLSGDLKDPGKSLPRGTFLAVGISLVIYVGIAVVFAASLPGSDLVADKNAMRRVASVTWLVDAGVIAATLSSALASFLGAPRILQSLAADRVFPMLSPFAVGHGTRNNPRRGVMFCLVLALGTIAMGDLDVIAPVVSMFFLISYGLLNYATFVEARANSPSFRPRFRYFDQRLSLIGGLACLGAMIAINPTAAVISVVLLFAVHQYVAASVGVERWADSGNAQRFQRLRGDLLSILAQPKHPRYWRPVLLAFSDDRERRGRLLRLATWLEGGSGITTIVRLIEGEGAQARKQRAEVERELLAEIDELKVPAFPRAILTPYAEGAVPVLLQSYGLGPLRANTALLNWPNAENAEDPVQLAAYGRRLRLGLRYDCNLVAFNGGAQQFEKLDATAARDRVIDVWYRDNATGRLMLLLAYLMTRVKDWQDARIRVFALPNGENDPAACREELERMLDDARIAAQPTIVEDLSPGTVSEHSGDASFVFFPLRLDGNKPCSVSGAPLGEYLSSLGLVALTLARQDIALDAEPEAGEYAEVAQAVDSAQQAEKTAAKIEKDATKAEKEAQKLRLRVEEVRAEGDVERLPGLETASSTAAREAERSRRRAAKARVIAEGAAREAEELTGPGGPTEAPPADESTET
jgi:amino acid transporter